MAGPWSVLQSQLQSKSHFTAKIKLWPGAAHFQAHLNIFIAPASARQFVKLIKGRDFGRSLPLASCVNNNCCWRNSKRAVSPLYSALRHTLHRSAGLNLWPTRDKRDRRGKGKGKYCIWLWLAVAGRTACPVKCARFGRPFRRVNESEANWPSRHLFAYYQQQQLQPNLHSAAATFPLDSIGEGLRVHWPAPLWH